MNKFPSHALPQVIKPQTPVDAWLLWDLQMCKMRYESFKDSWVRSANQGICAQAEFPATWNWITGMLLSGQCLYFSTWCAKNLHSSDLAQFDHKYSRILWLNHLISWVEANLESAVLRNAERFMVPYHSGAATLSDNQVCWYNLQAASVEELEQMLQEFGAIAYRPVTIPAVHAVFFPAAK
jgi:hypothetical protein